MGKFDLNPDELSKFDLRPEESAAKSKYPQPKSLGKSDEELGLSSGMADPRVPGNRQALYKSNPNSINAGKPGTDALATEPELSPVEKQLRDKYGSDIDFLKEAAPYAVGGALGKVIGGAVGRVAVKPVANRVAQASEVMSKAIENTASEHLNSAILKSLGILVGPEAAAAAKAVPLVARGAAAGVAAALPGATAAASPSAVPVKPIDESGAKPYRGVWSNAVERLRASAPGNPRAQELLSRIDAIPDSGAGTGTVTQGTLGE